MLIAHMQPIIELFSGHTVHVDCFITAAIITKLLQETHQEMR